MKNILGKDVMTIRFYHSFPLFGQESDASSAERFRRLLEQVVEPAIHIIFIKGRFSCMALVRDKKKW